jgi:signal transduction histidine kinase
MFEVVETEGSGWVEYMWPKPGESVATQKSAYVSKATVASGDWLLVGAGVYLADAPKAPPDSQKLTAPQLMALVREGAALFEKIGEAAYAEFRQKGSKWSRDDTYFIVYTLDGTRTFHGANPSLEGKDVSGARDVQGRPYGRMFRQVGASASGEGWVHYMYPEPGELFPAWKSTFIKRVTSPSGKQHLIGSAVYDMKMEKAFIEDVVDRAAALVATHGTGAFDQLRDKTGPFVFMDTYTFVESADGTELVNAAQPALEGKNLLDLKDVTGKALVREYIEAASRAGSAWVEYHWYKPGHNVAVRKQAYVRTVRRGGDTYFVGSGLYLEE